MKAFTYLLYIIFWEGMCIGGSAYLVFVQERSGWYLFLGVVLSTMACSPREWIHGKDDKK